MPGLNFTSSIDSGFEEDLNRMNAKMNGFSKNVVDENTKIDNSFRNLAMGVGAYFTADALMGFTTQLINVRGEFEKLGIAFETMLGDKMKAETLMSEITQLAASTPFSLTEVAQGAKQLIAFGESNTTVTDTLRRLGDVAAGVSTDIGGLTQAYGKVMTKGKLDTEVLNIFAERGVPLYRELATVMGVAREEIPKMVEQGKIGFPQVQQAIKNLTDEGGTFFNLMEKQAGSVSGMVSNLGDAYDQMLNQIGEGNEGVLKGSIAALTSLVSNWESVLKVIKIGIATYGAYKAALITTIAWENAKAISAARAAVSGKVLTTWETIHTAVLYQLARAQAAVNATMMANPYALALGAIVGVIAAIVLYTDKTEEVNKAAEAMARVSTKVADEFSKQKGSIETLLDTARNQALTDKQRLQAIKDIKEIMPDYNAEISKEGKLINENTTAIEAYLKQLELKIKMTAVQDELATLWAEERKQLKASTEATKNYNEALKEQAEFAKLPKVVVPGQTNMPNSVAEDVSARAKEAADAAALALLQTRKAIGELKKEYQTAQKSVSDFINASTAGGVKSIQTIKQLEEELSALEKERKEQTDRNNQDALGIIDAKIAAKKKELEKYSVKKVKEDKNPELTALELLNEQRINDIKTQYGKEESMKKEFDIKMLENDLVYLEAKKKLVNDKLKETQIEGDIITKGQQLDNLKGGKTLNDLLKKYKTYTDQRKEIYDTYQKDIDKLNQAGNVREAELAIQARDAALASVDTTILGMDESYQKWLKETLPKTIEQGAAVTQKKLNDLSKQLEIEAPKLSPEELLALTTQIEVLTKELDKLKGKTKDANKEFKDTMEVLDGLNGLLFTFVDTVAGSNENIKIIAEGAANAVDGLLNMAAGIKAIGDATTNMEKASAIIMVLSAALKVANAILKANKEIEQAKTEEALNHLKAQQAVNMALLEQNMLYEEGSKFFASDLWGAALNSLNNYNRALTTQNEAYKDITESIKNGSDTGWNLGNNNRAKSKISAIVRDADEGRTEQERALARITIQEKERRAIIGTKKVYSSLLDEYPGLIKANGELDAAVLQVAIDSGKLNDADKSRLQNLLDLNKKAAESYAQFGEYISSIFGNVADDITMAFQTMYESTIDAVDGTENAMDSLNQSFSDMIETFTRNALEFTFLQPLINSLNATTEALGVRYAKNEISADALQKNIITTLGDFYKSLATVQPEILQAYKNADELAAAAGFDKAFNPATTTADQLTGSAATPQSKGAEIAAAITEETGGQLVGRMGAIMLSNERIANINQDMYDLSVKNLVVMNQIRDNTSYLPIIADNTRKTVEKLGSV